MVTCTTCGAANDPGARFCGGCGSPLAVAAPAPPPPAGANPWMWVAIVAVVAMLVVGGIALYVTGQDDDETATIADQTPATTTPPTTAPPTTASTTTTAPTTTAPPTTAPSPTAGPVGDVLDQPSGLFCRDLEAKGYSYSAAVDYWRSEGNTNRMDADRNGIPCETVYPRSDVVSYWGDIGYGDPVFDYLDGLPSGLFCRDLDDRGFSYGEAVAYWYSEGAPDRMDEDLNGIPCETVYPASTVASYWGFG